MSAADRDYWREPDSSGSRLGFRLPPVTRVLFFSLIGCFLAQAINDVHGSPQILRWLALTTEGIRKGWAWQLITFQFLHGGILHLVGNLFALWVFGPVVERILGSRRFLLAYFLSGVTGGLLQALFMVSAPSLYAPAVVGASAGLEGIFAIFALLHRDSVFMLFLVLPMRAITLYYVVGGMSLFFTLVPSGLGGGVAHAAHLGGLILGTLWVRQNWHQDYQPLPGAELWERLTRLFRRRPRRLPIRSESFSRERTTVEDLPGKPRRTVLPARQPDLSSEVDPILDKIAQHGMHSLTATERQKLDEVRRKMTGR